MAWDFDEWYEENKERLSRERKLKYRSNKEYREKRKAASRDYYDRTKRRLRPVDRFSVSNKRGERFVTIGRVAALINRHVETVRGYHRRGVIPNPTVFDSRGWRLYTQEQLNLMVSAFHRLDGGDLGSLAEVAQALARGWQ